MKKRVLSCFIAIILLCNIVPKASAANSLALSINWEHIRQVGHQISGGQACTCYAYAYCKTILDGQVHYYTEFNQGTNEYNAWASWTDGATYTGDFPSNKNDAFKKLYTELSNRKPAAVKVAGSRSSHHYVAVVGYENVQSESNLSASNFLIIDPCAPEFKTENMAAVGYDLKMEDGVYQVTYSTTGKTAEAVTTDDRPTGKTSAEIPSGMNVIIEHNLDGVNNGRPANALVVFTNAGEKIDTNEYGYEVAINSSGSVVAVRDYGSTRQLSVPDSGFVLSGHVLDDNSGGAFVNSIIKMMDDVRVVVDYDANRVLAYGYPPKQQTSADVSPTVFWNDGNFTVEYKQGSRPTFTAIAESRGADIVSLEGALYKEDSPTPIFIADTIQPNAAQYVFNKNSSVYQSIPFETLKAGRYLLLVTASIKGYGFTLNVHLNVTEANNITNVALPKQTIYFQDQFTDVPSNQWYTKNVAEAFELGLMKGNSSTTFNPYGDVTIAEAVTMASRIHNIYTNGGENIRKATSGEAWYQPYLDYAYSNGIIRAALYNSNVSQKANRAQFAEIFANALPNEALSTINSVTDNAIPDVKTSESYASYVYKLYRAGILGGSDANGTFHPTTYITRAEAATIVARMGVSTNRINISLG